MPLDGSAHRPETPREPPHPPEVLTWTPRVFSPPVSPAAAEWGRFLLALGFGLVLFGAISLLMLGR